GAGGNRRRVRPWNHRQPPPLLLVRCQVNFESVTVVLPTEPYRPARDPAPQTAAAVTGFILVAIAALYLGRGVLGPLVLGTVLAVVLGPAVPALRRVGMPLLVATTITIILAATAFVCIGYLVITQLMKLAADLPQYQLTIAQKIRDLQETA